MYDSLAHDRFLQQSVTMHSHETMSNLFLPSNLSWNSGLVPQLEQKRQKQNRNPWGRKVHMTTAIIQLFRRRRCYNENFQFSDCNVSGFTSCTVVFGKKKKAHMQTGLERMGTAGPRRVSALKFVLVSASFSNISVSTKVLNCLGRRVRSVGFLQNSPSCPLKPEKGTWH